MHMYIIIFCACYDSDHKFLTIRGVCELFKFRGHFWGADVMIIIVAFEGFNTSIARTFSPLPNSKCLLFYDIFKT